MSEMPSVLERVRMCLAEAGYDPMLVSEPTVPGGAFKWSPPISAEVAWRAREVALIGRPLCFACRRARAKFARRHGHFPHERRCLAARRCVEDCGQTDRIGEA